MLIFYPAMIALGSWGERVKAERVEEGNGGLDFQGLPLLVLKGDDQAVRISLGKGGDANDQDNYGTPVLHLAALMDDGEMVEILLENGADIEGRGGDGERVDEVADEAERVVADERVCEIGEAGLERLFLERIGASLEQLP